MARLYNRHNRVETYIHIGSEGVRVEKERMTYSKGGGQGDWDVTEGRGEMLAEERRKEMKGDANGEKKIQRVREKNCYLA